MDQSGIERKEGTASKWTFGVSVVAALAVMVIKIA
jgi:hypothetical protein